MATEPNTPEEAIRLREYLGVLGRRKWSIIAITLLGLLGALFYAKQQPNVYDATSKVLATNVLPLGIGVTQGGNAGPNMDTEVEVVTSEPVEKCAALILDKAVFQADPTGPLVTPNVPTWCSDTAISGLDINSIKDLTKHVAVTFPQQSSILEITYSDTIPKKSVAGAQAFALAYIQIKTASAQATLATLQAPILTQLNGDKSQKITGLVPQLAGLQKQYADLTTKIAGETDSAQKASDQAQLQNLTAQETQVSQQIANLNQELLNLDPSKIVPPQLALPAKLPKKPSSPNKLLDGILGLFVGIAFGGGLALLRERLDDGLRGRTDLEQNLGVPVLAVIPKVPGWRKRQEAKLVALDQPKSAVAEAYRTLRTSIVFTAVQRGVKTIMVVSPTAGEGKTTTAANVAVTLANANKRVILVSADLRKPRVHRFFDLENAVGLSNVLSGEVKPWEALQDPKVENLRVMSSGPVPARPAELLQSEQMGELLVELREVADFVVIDTAPILLVADALALAPLVDGVLFVADSEVSTRGSVNHAREQLEQVGAPILGAIYNNFDPSKGRTYYPYSGYYGPYYRYRYGRYGRYGGYETYYGSSSAPAPRNGEKAQEREARPAVPVDVPPSSEGRSS